MGRGGEGSGEEEGAGADAVAPLPQEEGGGGGAPGGGGGGGGGGGERDGGGGGRARGEGKGERRERKEDPVVTFAVGDPAPKRMPKPDRARTQRELDGLKAIEEAKLEELAELKRSMQEVDASRSGARAVTGEARVGLQRLRGEMGVKVREAQALRAQMKALGEQRAAEQRKAVALRSGLGGLTSVEAIDEEVARLEGVISHESNSVAEEKRLIGQIKALQASKKTVDEYAAVQMKVRELEEERKGLGVQMDEVQAEIDRVKKLLDVEEKGFHAAKGKEGESESGMAPLIESRQRAREVLNEVRDKIREVRTDLKAREDAYYLAERQWRTWNKVQRQAEWEGLEKERKAEAELNRPVPYAQEIELCDGLTAYLKRLIPEKTAADSSEGASTAPAEAAPAEIDLGGLNLGKGKGGGVAVARVGKKGSNADDDDDDFFGVKKQGGKKGGKKGGAGGGGGGKANGAAKATRLTLDVETFVSFERVQLTAPSTTDAVGKSIEELAKKRAEFVEKQKVKMAEREAKAAAGESTEDAVAEAASKAPPAAGEELPEPMMEGAPAEAEDAAGA